MALLLRKRVYHHLEAGLQFFNEKSGWTEVEKVFIFLQDIQGHTRTYKDSYRTHIRTQKRS
jgi:hypothetical protein